MRSVAVTRSGTVELRSIEEPKIGPYDALVRTELSYICNATDRKIVHRHFPGLPESSYPLLLGHESVGIVQDTGPKVTGFKQGDRVIGALHLNPGEAGLGSAWGGHSEFTVVRDYAAMIREGAVRPEDGWNELFQIQLTVPLSIDPETAALMCTWREVYSAFHEDFSLRDARRILVFGAGPVGLSFVLFAKLAGVSAVTIVDPIPEKRDLATALGADNSIEPCSETLNPIDRNMGGSLPSADTGFDAVVDAVGSARIIDQAASLISNGGKICGYGVTADSHFQIKRMHSPHNFELLVHQWPTRAAEARAHSAVIELINAGKIPGESFVTAEYPVESISEAMADAGSGSNLKTRIRF